MEFEYKGYTLIQSSYNWHFRIVDASGHVVLHASYTKPLKKEEAEEKIDTYLTMFNSTLEKLNPYCDLLKGNRPENDSDTQYDTCSDCFRYDICKNYYESKGKL